MRQDRQQFCGSSIVDAASCHGNVIMRLTCSETKQPALTVAFDIICRNFQAETEQHQGSDLARSLAAYKGVVPLVLTCKKLSMAPSSDDGEKVQLYVYDLSNGLARQLSPMLLNKQVCVIVFVKYTH